MSKPSASSNSMQVGLACLRKVEIHNDIDTLNVNSSRKQIRTHQASTISITEIMEHFIPVILGHFCMNIVTRIAKFHDFLCEQFYSQRRVAKNDRLINQQLDALIF